MSSSYFPEAERLSPDAFDHAVPAFGQLGAALQYATASVFLISSAGKMAGGNRFAEFVASVGAVRVARPSLSRPVATAVVVCEAAVCLSLAAPWHLARLVGSAGAVLLLTAFCIAIIKAVRSGAETSCRCFGSASLPLGWHHVLRNAVLIAFAVIGAVTDSAGRPEDPGALALCAFAGLFIGILITALDDIIQLFAPLERQEKDLL